jgi:hypothetical protein
VSNQYNDLLVSQMAEPLDAEKNLALFRRVKTGDAAAREEMIVGNMPLAVAKVESFIRCFPEAAHLRDDLTSAAFVGLVKAVNKMAAGRGPRKAGPSAPVDFIGMWINRELSKLMEIEGIAPPHTSKARARAQGQELTVPTVVNAVPARCEARACEKELETRDLLDACCTDDGERTFVAMRTAGHTLADIAEALGTPVHTASNLARRVKARIRATLAQDGQLPPCREQQNPRKKRVARQRANAAYYQAHREELVARAKNRRRKKRGW